eukprot:c21449_g1_i1 orf=369-1445(+)
MNSTHRSKVVVVGGGVAGAHVAKFLENDADVTLIDPKDHFEIPYGGLRCVVDPTFAQLCLVPHTEYLKNAKHVAGSADSASSTDVVTTFGENLPYDFLVVATGSAHTGPITKAERIKHFQSEHQKLKDGSTVLIIGGGPVGVELAGEIVVDFPEKKVILLHSGKRLIEFLGPGASKKAYDWLKSKKVEIYLNERIDLGNLSPTTREFTTSTGKVLNADCHFVCVGKKLGSSWLHKTIVKDKLDQNERLRVDKHLRVEGETNVFACGDITAIKEIKQGFLAGKHAKVIADNIKRLSNNSCGKLATYKPLDSPMGMVSLGRNIAVAQLPFGTVIGRLPGMMKSKDLFVGKTRKGLGLQAT